MKYIRAQAGATAKKTVPTNLARKLEIEPETALRRATAKFERRFRQVETLARERGIGRDLDDLEDLWEEVKRAENRVYDETAN